MSGGPLGSSRYQIAEWLDTSLAEVDTRKEDGSHVYSKETRKKIGECVASIKEAQVILNRLDYLFAGDDGEDTFHARLEQDLKEARIK